MGSKTEGNEHLMYICDLQKMANSAQIKRLTNKPEYRCGICGAVANDAKNLCEKTPGHL